MQKVFNVEQFISEHITLRSGSLLDQDFRTFNDDLSERIGGKSVLVIGAAGTIGSSFVKALIRFSPSKLVVVDTNENGLTELVRDCRSQAGLSLPADFKSYPVNFGDSVFRKIFLKEGPFHIVGNFAAHKHVRSEKDIYSIEAMINNNVIKAKMFLDLLLRYPPEHFFCVSTDKAANPVNIMGASKKLMEEVILAYSDKLKITTARFANVAFSNGSLLAGFIERLAKRQPLSSPSDVKRFFVSPRESGEICLAACILGHSGEIFFPKLEESQMVNFASIIPPFLDAFGFIPDFCESEDAARKKAAVLDGNAYPVYLFASETSGEKLYEEFYTDDEQLELSRFSSLGVIRNAKRRSFDELSQVIGELERFFMQEGGKSDLVALLNTMLPGFRHIETGVNLDQKM
jgi:FlaA1/EpsC-like NDP-sugar epimerase